MKSLIKFIYGLGLFFAGIYFVERNYQSLNWDEWYRILGITGGIVLITH